ncbi:hypothetical protein N7E81_00855 [Reichenbachiella carrageenanivorans]|uniref:Uncharacterized protein n=1 Tax=Reichenbachiella carrageenanivorans TaxID=2979869 RepID=A0ABY6D164_9BACT|nr:hypothetical protein [Reichenbachiella carrageenanivorans]UXX79659.1 hypothetical protein N7E81_00855 [Reichenbachiella carrageenanivorans]
MNRIIAISLLLLYTLVWAKPFVPYVEYALSKDYAVLSLDTEKLDAGFTRCEDICNLEEQLAKYANEESSADRPMQQVKLGHEVLMHILIDTNTSFAQLGQGLLLGGMVYYFQSYYSIYGDVASPPPKFA